VIWTTYEYESENWDIFFDWRDLHWPGGFTIDSFPSLWLYSRPPVVTNLTTWISSEAMFDAEVGEHYRVMGWNRSGFWGDYAALILQAGDNLHPTVSLPSLRAEEFLAFQFVRARIGLPIHTLRVNGAPAISIGGVLPITLPATGGTTLSLSVSNILGRVLQNGPQIVWEVWDAINNVRLGNSTLGAIFDLQLTTSGQFRVVARLDDRAGVAFTFDAQRPEGPAFITPGGNPVAAPLEAGSDPNNIPDGANEFTFSFASPGVLAIMLKARVPGLPGLSPADQARYRFVMPNVGDSALAWDPANPLGQPMINGEILEAKITYTGLPTENLAFGLKTARLVFGSVPVVDQPFEVFYPRDGNNHPGSQPGSRNWFYYWMRTPANNTNTTTVYYNGAGAYYSFLEKKIYIGNDVYFPGIQAWGCPVGIDHFAWVTAHEAKHHSQLTSFWPAGYDPTQDQDTYDGLQEPDWIPATVELNYMPGRPYDPMNARTYFDTIGYNNGATGIKLRDDEDINMRSQTPPYDLVDPLWSNGSANSHDWANPGKNSKVVQ
jgi:hypothetical protein